MLAKEKRVWGYRGLTYGYLPYVLLTLMPEFEAKPPKRAHACFFAFPPTTRRLDELWNIPQRAAAILWKITRETGDVERINVDPKRPPGEFDWVEEVRNNVSYW